LPPNVDEFMELPFFVQNVTPKTFQTNLKIQDYFGVKESISVESEFSLVHGARKKRG
jgi:hypothetical protein